MMREDQGKLVSGSIEMTSQYCLFPNHISANVYFLFVFLTTLHLVFYMFS